MRMIRKNELLVAGDWRNAGNAGGIQDPRLLCLNITSYGGGVARNLWRNSWRCGILAALWECRIWWFCPEHVQSSGGVVLCEASLSRYISATGGRPPRSWTRFWRPEAWGHHTFKDLCCTCNFLRSFCELIVSFLFPSLVHFFVKAPAGLCLSSLQKQLSFASVLLAAWIEEEAAMPTNSVLASRQQLWHLKWTLHSEPKSWNKKRNSQPSLADLGRVVDGFSRELLCTLSSSRKIIVRRSCDSHTWSDSFQCASCRALIFEATWSHFSRWMAFFGCTRAFMYFFACSALQLMYPCI